MGTVGFGPRSTNQQRMNERENSEYHSAPLSEKCHYPCISLPVSQSFTIPSSSPLPNNPLFLSLSRSLTLPLLRLISEVHWNPGKLFQHLRSVRVLWRTFWMCWCVQAVTLPADMALHHTICQRLQVNSAPQARIMDGASSNAPKRQSYNSVPQFVCLHCMVPFKRLMLC